MLPADNQAGDQGAIGRRRLAELVRRHGLVDELIDAEPVLEPSSLTAGTQCRRRPKVVQQWQVEAVDAGGRREHGLLPIWRKCIDLRCDARGLELRDHSDGSRGSGARARSGRGVRAGSRDVQKAVGCSSVEIEG